MPCTDLTLIPIFICYGATIGNNDERKLLVEGNSSESQKCKIPSSTCVVYFVTSLSWLKHHLCRRNIIVFKASIYFHGQSWHHTKPINNHQLSRLKSSLISLLWEISSFVISAITDLGEAHIDYAISSLKYSYAIVCYVRK